MLLLAAQAHEPAGAEAVHERLCIHSGLQTAQQFWRLLTSPEHPCGLLLTLQICMQPLCCRQPSGIFCTVLVRVFGPCMHTAPGAAMCRILSFLRLDWHIALDVFDLNTHCARRRRLPAPPPWSSLQVVQVLGLQCWIRFPARPRTSPAAITRWCSSGALDNRPKLRWTAKRIVIGSWAHAACNHHASVHSHDGGISCLRDTQLISTS